MQKQTIISKGKYAHAQPEQLITLKQYILRESAKGERELLLRFANERAETCHGFGFAVYQLDARGNLLDECYVESTDKRRGAKSEFAFDKKIKLQAQCTDFRIRLVYARFGDYVYDVQESGVLVRYEKRGTAQQSKSGKSASRSSSSHAAKRIWMPALITLVVLTLLFGFFTYYLGMFMKDRDHFSLSGIEYEFVTRFNGSKGVEIVGYSGIWGNLLLPTEIEGYPVLGIREGAFEGNSSIRRVRVEGLSLPNYVFRNCRNLAEVELKDVSYLGEEAFANCISLETLSLHGLDMIGNRAFVNCASLTTLSVTHDNIETVLDMGDAAFANCTALQSISIAQPVRYPTSPAVFYMANSVKSLHLYDLKHTLEDGTEYVPTIASLFGVMGGSSLSSLREISIDYIEELPISFCSGLGALESFTVKQSEITVVPQHAFYNCASLRTLQFNGAVTDVGEGAFYNTRIEAFDGSALVNIGSSAFEGCVALKSLPLGEAETLVTIGLRAFVNCQSLESFVIPSTVTYLPEAIFTGCLSLREVRFAQGSTVTAIPAYFFSGCASLQSVSLPTSVAAIRANAFRGCASLRELPALDNITVLESFAFAECTSLTTATLPEHLTEVPDGIFLGCSMLQQVTLSAQTTRIGDQAFANCTSLGLLALPQTLQYLGAESLAGTSFQQIVLPSGLLQIGQGVFKGCAALHTVTLPFVGGSTTQSRTLGHLFGVANADVPATLKKVIVAPQGNVAIAERAFAGCAHIEEVVLQDGVTAIREAAFENCRSLNFLSLPATLTSLSSAYTTFQNCYRLFEIENLTGMDLTWTGNIAQYALEVRTTAGARAPRVTTENAVFALYSGNWYLIDCAEGSSSLDFTAAVWYQERSIRWQIPAHFFRDNTSLKTVLLSGAVTAIGEQAFAYCSNLELLRLSPNLQSIGNYAFYGCYNLFDVYYTGELLNLFLGSTTNGYVARYAVAVHRTLGEEVSDTVTLMDGTLVLRRWRGNALVLGYSGSSSDLSLTKLYTGNTSIRIADSAFRDCESLQNLVLGPEVSQIQASAFASCDNLRQVSISGNALTEIENDAFAYCGRLQSVTLPDSVLTIGNNAFYNCSLMESITMPASLQKIGSYAFYNCHKLLSITVPQGVTSIGDGAFSGCRQLFEVYDLSTALTLSKGAYSNGYVAYYAKVVYTSTASALTRTERDGFLFVKADNVWYLYSAPRYVKGELITVPGVGTNVTVLPSAFVGWEVSSILLPTTISGFEDGIFVDCSLWNTSVYYLGNATQWGRVEGRYEMPGNVYFYGACVHDSSTWTYVNGVISRMPCTLIWGVLEEPTCLTGGTMQGVCACGCGYTEEEYLSPNGHTYKDGVCVDCGEAEPAKDEEDELN